jgi:Gpi18-like mannosyltransferase
MTPRIATATFAVALLAGAAIRVSVLPIRVAEIDESWRAWSYHAATDGAAQIYGPRGHTVGFGPIDVPVVYPPLAIDELAIVGRIYARLTHGRFPDDARLTIAIKSTIVVFEIALTALLYDAVRRVRGSAAARLGAAAYWLNPAVLATTSLGYLDALVALPATGAVIAASAGRPLLSGGLLAAAVLTKPQGIFVAPAIVLALWNAGDRHHAAARLTSAVCAAAAVAAALCLPLVAAGTLSYMLRSVAVLAGHDMLSALAFNVWWIVSYLFAAVSAAGGGLRAALTAQPAIVTHAYAIERGFPHPRLVAIAMLLPLVGWACSRARAAADLGLHAALAALIVISYFMVSVQVHENHFFLAVPFLTIAAALRPEFAAVSAALSITFALNVILIYGWAGHTPATTRLPIAHIDATVIVATCNCVLFVWFAATFARACRSTGLAERSVSASVQHRRSAAMRQERRQ